MTMAPDSIPSRSARLRTPSDWAALALTVHCPPSRPLAPARAIAVVHTSRACRASGTPDTCEDTASCAEKGAGARFDRLLRDEQVPCGVAEGHVRVGRGDPAKAADVAGIDQGG